MGLTQSQIQQIIDYEFKNKLDSTTETIIQRFISNNVKVDQIRSCPISVKCLAGGCYIKANQETVINFVQKGQSMGNVNMTDMQKANISIATTLKSEIETFIKNYGNLFSKTSSEVLQKLKATIDNNLKKLNSFTNIEQYSNAILIDQKQIPYCDKSVSPPVCWGCKIKLNLGPNSFIDISQSTKIAFESLITSLIVAQLLSGTDLTFDFKAYLDAKTKTTQTGFDPWAIVAIIAGIIILILIILGIIALIYFAPTIFGARKAINIAATKAALK